jgi:hypothetical protein
VVFNIRFNLLGGIDRDAIKGELYHMKVVQEDNDSGSWAVHVAEAKFDDLWFQVHKKAKAVLSTSTDVIGLPNEQGTYCTCNYMKYINS